MLHSARRLKLLSSRSVNFRAGRNRNNGEVPAQSARASHALDHEPLRLGLLVSGVEFVISHPRFYWGEDGNAWMTALFKYSDTSVAY